MRRFPRHSRKLAPLVILVILGFTTVALLPPEVYAQGPITGIGPWTEQTDYGASSGNSGSGGIHVLGVSCVTYSTYLYCVGGQNSTGTDLSRVFYAPVSSSGSVGAWAETTDYGAASGTSGSGGIGIEWPSCVQYNGYIYCVGGVTSTGVVSDVFYAQLSSSGVGAWTETTDYGATSGNTGSGGMTGFQHSCAVDSGYVYCVGSGFGTSKVFYAQLSSGGVGAWTETTDYGATSGNTGSGGVAIASNACVTNKGYIYCIGGTVSFNPVSKTFYAPVNSSGVGAWTETTDYGAVSGSSGSGGVPIYGTTCVDYSSNVICVDGDTTGNTGTNGVYYVQDEALGEWIAAAIHHPELAYWINCVIYYGIPDAFLECYGGATSMGYAALIQTSSTSSSTSTTSSTTTSTTSTTTSTTTASSSSTSSTATSTSSSTSTTTSTAASTTSASASATTSSSMTTTSTASISSASSSTSTTSTFLAKPTPGNDLLYIGIGIVILILAAAAYLLTRKKGGTPEPPEEPGDGQTPGPPPSQQPPPPPPEFGLPVAVATTARVEPPPEGYTPPPTQPPPEEPPLEPPLTRPAEQPEPCQCLIEDMEITPYVHAYTPQAYASLATSIAGGLVIQGRFTTNRGYGMVKLDCHFVIDLKVHTHDNQDIFALQYEDTAVLTHGFLDGEPSPYIRCTDGGGTFSMTTREKIPRGEYPFNLFIKTGYYNAFEGFRNLGITQPTTLTGILEVVGTVKGCGKDHNFKATKKFNVEVKIRETHYLDPSWHSSDQDGFPYIEGLVDVPK